MSKPIGTKDKIKGNKRGLKPKDRQLIKPKKGKKITGNQWRATPQQELFMDNWINPKSESFGNAYESAIRAGYSRYHAIKIASPSINNKWIQEFRRKQEFGIEHIKQGMQDLAVSANNSRSPDDTRLSAYEALARVHSLGGYGRGNNTLQVTVVQPILGGESVKRTKVPSEVIDP